jgi:hypothetical protein
VQNPRIDISDLGKEFTHYLNLQVGVLTKMQNNSPLEFTILPNPYAMKGHIMFL